MKKPQPPPAPKSATELNGYQAAALVGLSACRLVGLSPRLLRWLGGHAPKQGAERKLKIRKEGEDFFVERQELVDFNDWLKVAWPSKDGGRPPIPSGIRREIKDEAGGECAMCQKNGNSCEAAHIDPVAKSKNNHPENLVWLCANHHTKFDNGALGPTDEAKDFVVGYKQPMALFRLALWKFQAEVTGQLFTILKACETIKGQLDTAKTPEQKAAVEALAKKAIAQVPKMAPTSKSDPDYAAFTAMKPQFEQLAASAAKPKNIAATLSLAQTVKTEFARQAGYEDCPLCEGKGHYKHEDCPECGGVGELTKAEARNVDLARYGEVRCPLCEGKRTFKGEDCPACGGDGQMERRYADQVNPSEWADVDCSLCIGSGRHKGDDCPACDGEGTLERHQRDQLDLREYEEADCPLCKGKGSFGGNDCPECHGERTMERRYADQVDVRQYETEKCFLCKGSGEWFDRPCPPCGGEGELDRWQAEQIDRGQYKMVDCPSCDRRDREYCQTCGGEGKIPRYVADRL
ncbi:zinc finger domain-containing protein [Brevundimonas sp. DWR2-3-1b1]|uniref:zinc finger domain-containing protein n=1 Tax=Brevundimonas sp. DWR2-3-1b1 TaxID=2804641 RepID=UPI003CFACF7B